MAKKFAQEFGRHSDEIDEIMAKYPSGVIFSGVLLNLAEGLNTIEHAGSRDVSKEIETTLTLLDIAKGFLSRLRFEMSDADFEIVNEHVAELSKLIRTHLESLQ